MFEPRRQYRPLGRDERLRLGSRLRFAWFRERVVNQRVGRSGLKRTDETFIQLCHWGYLASAEAFDLRERDLLARRGFARADLRSEEHTSELQSLTNLVCRLLLEKKK